LEGKRITEEKRIDGGKLLKGNCQRGVDRKSILRTLYIGFRKAKENMRQCKSEHRGFKKAEVSI
jgi:hypothetical protein